MKTALTDQKNKNDYPLDGPPENQIAGQKDLVARKKLRIGIVGAGLMGKWHSRSAVKSGGVIVGIADSNVGMAKDLQKDHRDSEIFDDLKRMLSQIPVDILHICTPTSSHRQIAEESIESGVNLFIEKPLAVSASETIQIYQKAAEQNVSICPAHQFIFQNCVENAKEMISAIGEIIHLNATICSAGSSGLSEATAHATAIDILPHPLSLFQKFLGRILSETTWQVSRPKPGELRIGGLENSVSLSIFISMSSRPPVNSLQIFGTKGTIFLDLFHDFAVFDDGRVSKTRKILHPFDLAFRTLSSATYNLLRRGIKREPAYPGLSMLISEFYRSVRQHSPPPITSEETINVAGIRDFVNLMSK